MPRQQSITFANVIVHFGSELVLLDLAEQIVIPAFTDPTLQRRFGETVYLFINTGWASYRPGGGQAEFCLFGQLVKNTVLRSDQVLLDGQLVPSNDSISSAPSAFFVLMLSNHKLVYLPETPFAPSLDTFGSTLKGFLRTKHSQYINAEYLQRKGTPTAVTKTALLEEIPAPEVEVMPLASRESIKTFVESIDKLTHLEFRVLETNREFQMAGPYEQIRDRKQRLGAKTSKLTYDNSAGMSKKEVASQIEESAASGNQAVIVAGVADDGTKIRGNNNQLRMQVPVEDLPAEPRPRAFRLIDIFRGHAASENIALDTAADSQAQVERIAQKLIGDGHGQS